MSYHELENSGDLESEYFLSFVPRDETYLEYNIDPVPLKVIRTNGVQVTPLMNITETDIRSYQKGSPNTPGHRRKFFTDHGYEGIRFKVDVILNVDDEATAYTKRRRFIPNTKLGDNAYVTENIYTLHDPKTIDVLRYVIENTIPVNVVTRAIDIPNGLYLITKNDSRKQTNDKNTIWSLEFTKYVQFYVTQYQNDNSVVLNAITKARKARQAYQAKMTAQAKKNAVSISANGKKLKACGVSKLKYSSKQKDVLCVRYLQKALTGLKLYTRQIDGWYGKYTKAAVKAFQKKYKKTYNLKVNGVMDTKTLNAIIKKDVKK